MAVKDVVRSEGWSVEKVDDPLKPGAKIMRITWNPSDGRKLEPSDFAWLENYDLRYVVRAESQEDQLTLLKYSNAVDNSVGTASDIWKRGLKKYMDEKYKDVEFSLEEDPKGDFPRLKCYFSKRHLQSFDRSEFENHLQECYLKIGNAMFFEPGMESDDGSYDLLRQGAKVSEQIVGGKPPWHFSSAQLRKQRNCMRCYTDKKFGELNKEALKYFSLPDMKTEYKEGSVEVLVGGMAATSLSSAGLAAPVASTVPVATAVGTSVGTSTCATTAAAIATTIPVWGWVVLGVVIVAGVAYTATKPRPKSIRVWGPESNSILEIVFDPPRKGCPIL